MVARYIFGMLGNNCRQKGSPVHILAILMRIAQWWLSLGSFKEGYTMVAGLIFGILDHRGELVKSCSRTMNQEKVTSYGGLMHEIYFTVQINIVIIL